MKKMFIIFSFIMAILISSGYTAQNKWRLRGELVDGTTTYWMKQKRDSWEATRLAENPTNTFTLNYQVGYSSATADAFWAVVDSTDNWHSSRDINLY